MNTCKSRLKDFFSSKEDRAKELKKCLEDINFDDAIDDNGLNVEKYNELCIELAKRIKEYQQKFFRLSYKMANTLMPSNARKWLNAVALTAEKRKSQREYDGLVSQAETLLNILNGCANYSSGRFSISVLSSTDVKSVFSNLASNMQNIYTLCKFMAERKESEYITGIGIILNSDTTYDRIEKSNMYQKLMELDMITKKTNQAIQQAIQKEKLPRDKGSIYTFLPKQELDNFDNHTLLSNMTLGGYISVSFEFLEVEKQERKQFIKNLLGSGVTVKNAGVGKSTIELSGCKCSINFDCYQATEDI